MFAETTLKILFPVFPCIFSLPTHASNIVQRSFWTFPKSLMSAVFGKMCLIFFFLTVSVLFYFSKLFENLKFWSSSLYQSYDEHLVSFICSDLFSSGSGQRETSTDVEELCRLMEGLHLSKPPATPSPAHIPQ